MEAKANCSQPAQITGLLCLCLQEEQARAAASAAALDRPALTPRSPALTFEQIAKNAERNAATLARKQELLAQKAAAAAARLQVCMFSAFVGNATAYRYTVSFVLHGLFHTCICCKIFGQTSVHDIAACRRKTGC